MVGELGVMEASFASETGKIADAGADDFCEVRLHVYTEEHVVVKRVNQSV
jgi:hypothetical protein